MKALLLLLVLCAKPVLAQHAPEGIWQGYDGEWKHVTSQLIALAEATPEDKFAWRPAKGVRSTGEVYMHIALANFYLLSVTGPKMPDDLKEDAEKTVTSKTERHQVAEALARGGESRARCGKARGSAAQGAYRRSRRDRRRNVSAHHCSCE